ncbi:DNA-binding transcriptional activator BglJ [Cronobacter muytjensii]|uniref:DNA-binding transcriptional activator BglJ n=1 Tax=Cronobacter muytjensii TaxID=413501 RepID=UPI001375FF7E|nr:DNA-binding transcriptional activator BglJ [Cronobacter muytjensii]NCH54273.1 DNA-binding transcriptional activator BglJ [Cronobacter muytjensii]
MEHGVEKRSIALIEKCVMSGEGIRSLLKGHHSISCRLEIFVDHHTFIQTLGNRHFSVVIFSLDGTREHRRDCLQFVSEMAKAFPRMKRIVMVNNVNEAKLISQLSPTPLQGIIDKSETLARFTDELMSAMNDSARVSESPNKVWYASQGSRLLSPTERIILRYLTDGYSVSQIACHLERNIKTIRAHKFNAMLKLGVHTDAGLLNAADILRHRAGLF